MAYTKQIWHDLPQTDTPINASRLAHIEDGIENVEQEINDRNTYSTSEINTGKTWTNGKPIYRKVIIATPSATMQWSTLAGSMVSNLENIINIQAMYGGYLPIPCFVTTEYYIALQYAAGTGVQAYLVGYPVAQISVVLEYTKTTN